MNRLQVLYKLDDLVDGPCKKCEKIKKVNDNHRAKYCVENCDVGKEIRRLGTLLGKRKQEKEGEKMEKKQVTKEQYLKLSNSMSEKDKAEALGISYGTLWNLKKSWGVTRPKREIEVVPAKEETPLPQSLTNLEKELKQRIAELEKEVELYKPYKEQIADLEAAAEDLENENAAHIDKICELEDELRLVDGAINTWKERALKAEEARELLSRQYRNLAEELDETHTVNSALKTTLKAVL